MSGEVRTTAIVREHRLFRTDHPNGMSTYECDPHGWWVRANTPDDKRWVEAALGEHIGVPVPVSLSHALAVTAAVRPCHPGCYGDDGHSDGCLVGEEDV